jgi:galactokinase/mevalonate kinase-like predicted kinase
MKNEKRKVKPQTMRLKQKKFLLFANVALDKINVEIENPKKHKKDDMNNIKEEIEKMKKALSTMEFQPMYPMNIVDHWRPDDKLGDLLLNLYYDYLDL